MIKAGHIAIQVEDIDRSLHFYRDVLGLTYIRTGESRGYVRVELSEGQINLSLLKPKEGQERSQPSRPEDAIGLDHIGFLVDDIDAIYDRLKKAGAEFDTPAPTDFFKVRDPDGVIVDIAAVSRGWDLRA